MLWWMRSILEKSISCVSIEYIHCCVLVRLCYYSVISRLALAKILFEADPTRTSN